MKAGAFEEPATTRACPPRVPHGRFVRVEVVAAGGWDAREGSRKVVRRGKTWWDALPFISAELTGKIDERLEVHRRYSTLHYSYSNSYQVERRIGRCSSCSAVESLVGVAMFLYADFANVTVRVE